MTPFNLELAKAGKPVMTKGGDKARIICFDRKVRNPLVVLVGTDESELLRTYNLDGFFYKDESDSPENLVMATEQKEGWINLHRNANGKVYSGISFETKEQAEKNVLSSNLIATIKITWEE